MLPRSLGWAFIPVLLHLMLPAELAAWGRGHRLIRLWAVTHLPAWQLERIGADHLERLCRDYTSLQDTHAGGQAPHLDRYCVVPGVRLSLHDVNPPQPSAAALLWYLDRIVNALQTGQTDEAMKFLGVLCHWNEDPGCPSAHSSPISEFQLRTLLPPPADKARFNYLYGAGGIMDVGNWQIPPADYTPRLLGRTREELALHIYQQQRLLRRRAAAHIVPIVQAFLKDDEARANRHRTAAALDNAQHVADVIYSVLCLATGRFDNPASLRDPQPLTEWLPDFRGGMIPHPYYVSPFLVNQAMTADRQLRPLQLNSPSAAGGAQPVDYGYGMGTPFSLDFTLAPGNVYRRLTCQVGIHPAAGPEGAVRFAIAANGQELYRTPPVRSGAAPESIDVELPLENVLKLSLRTIAVDGSKASHNLTVWSSPALHR